jgi:aspartate racemase
MGNHDLKQGVNGSSGNRCYGLVDGPGADGFFEHFSAALAASCDKKPLEILFPRLSENKTGEHQPEGDSLAALKIRTFDAVRKFEKLGVDVVLLPSFASQVFVEEIEAETLVPIISLMDALRADLSRRHLEGGRIGILGTNRLRESQLFERHFPPEHWTLLYPARDIDIADERLAEACQDLVRQGAESIIVTDALTVAAAKSLCAQGFPLIDALPVYAQYAATVPPPEKTKPFKIGVAGGVGPAATVDFLDKIVRNTPAQRDQEHIKVVVEQNPQIPDRTAHLVSGGTDPTIALYATCRRLVDAGADIITIPCNTAHAFVARIQPFLPIPIVNMLVETAEFIRRNHSGCSKVGLLATNGTVASRVYHEVIVPAGFELIVPDAENQQRVMNAIYGPKGAKAGFTEGECVDELLLALTSLAQRGADVILLGCTELPLLLDQNEAFPVDGRTVAVLDPTDILARKCVSLGRQAVGE